MPAQLSAEQIQKAEQMVQARMASDPAFSNKMREGKIKFLVEPGEKLSQIKIVDMTNAANVEKYGGRAMFNTPQEAEHFTIGFGRQPTREGGLKDVAYRATMPKYQHQINDPLRKYSKSKLADAGQDILSTARYAVPFGAMLTNVAPLPTMAITAGVGAAAKGLGALTGEEELQETWPNIAGNAAAAGTSVAANRYFSEPAVKERQLKKHVANQLGIKPRQLEEGLLPEIKQTLETTPYTFGDWRNRPLTQFDAANPDANVKFKSLPMVFTPGKEPGTTGAKVMPKGKDVKMSRQQWDAVAKKFAADVGMPDADPEQVKKFIMEAWARPQSVEGETFYGKKDIPKKRWIERKANEENPFTQELYKQQAYFEDPQMQEAYNKAMADYKARWKRMKTKGPRASIVTPQQYAKMGDYTLPIWAKLGNERLSISTRPIIRAGATLLPLAAQAVAPYAIKALTEDDND